MFRTAFKYLLKILILFLVLGWIGYEFVLLDVPDVDFLKDTHPARSSYMNQDPLLADNTEIHYIPLTRIPVSLIKAVLATEDDTFFQHGGFNLTETIKAIQANLKKGRLGRGGSTISQQLARNLFLSQDKTILRKLREAMLTWKLESKLSKNRILELYLNYAEFGPGIYGVSAASRYHFNKPPKSLNRSESALLASVLTNPSFYGKKPYPSSTYKKQRRALYKMSRYDLHLPQSLKGKSTALKITETRPSQVTKPFVQLYKDGAEDHDDFKEFDDSGHDDVFVDE